MDILDYDIYYDEALGGDFTLIGNNIEFLYYQTSVPLIADQVYKFKVTARNTVGDSLMSEAVAIRAARIPDIPLSLSDVPAVTTAF